MSILCHRKEEMMNWITQFVFFVECVCSLINAQTQIENERHRIISIFFFLFVVVVVVVIVVAVCCKTWNRMKTKDVLLLSLEWKEEEDNEKVKYKIASTTKRKRPWPGYNKRHRQKGGAENLYNFIYSGPIFGRQSHFTTDGLFLWLVWLRMRVK